MKKIISTFVFALLVLSTQVLAQSNNFVDYGLTEEDIKYLSDEEKQEILNSRTPAQTEDYFKKGIEDGSIKQEEIPPPLLPFLNEIQNNGVSENSPLSDQVVSCFDYYTFNSVEAPIQSRSTNAVSGTQMNFFGNIINKNSYPVVQGTLYVKIMKNIGGEKNSNGPDVIDQFIAMDNLTLPANGSVPLSFTWSIPAHAVSGDYRVVTYFTSDKKFNLQGLSFTDDVVGNSFDFKVTGEQKSLMMFDKSSVIINDDPYYFAAYPPRILKGKSADISLDILNDTDTDQDAQIKWKLYKWDSMHPDNLVREFTTNTKAQANSKTNLQVSIAEESEPVYLLVGELTYKDTKSIVNIRYVRDGVDKVRLNYPAVTSYPLIKGQQTTIFTCLHNSGQSVQVPNNKVILEVKDIKGKVIESYTYEGIITGDMMAVKKDFTPKTNLDKFSVHASIYTNGELVDESIMEYDCALIDPTSCTQESSSSITQIITAFITILLFILIIVFVKRKSKGIEVVVLLFVLSGSLLLFDIGVPKSIAQQVNPLPGNLVNPSITSGSKQALHNVTIASNFAYYANMFGGGANYWSPALKNPNISVKYNTKIINLDSVSKDEISDGATIFEGANIRLQFIPHHSYDIYWFGTGYSADSPYGDWLNSDATPIISCQEKDFVNRMSFTEFLANAHPGWQNYYYYVYIPLIISPPQKSFTNINNENLLCSSIQGNETIGYYVDCNVKKSGVLNPVFNFNSTEGKMYYRWKYYGPTDYSSITTGQCYGNNLPLKYSGNFVYRSGGYTASNVGNTFILQIPAKTISYSINVIKPPVTNNLPTISISGPSTGTVGNNYNFTFTATDTDTPLNKVKVEIDWDNDGIGGVFLPSGSEEYLSSPLTQLSSKSWGTTGSKTFKARAIDEFGAMSNWATHTITITDDLLPNTFYCQASPVNADLNQNVTFTAYPNNAISYAWKLPDGTEVSNSQTYTRSFTTSNTYTYIVDITTSSGKQTRSCSVSVGVPLQPTISTPTATFSFRPNITNTGGTCPFILSTTNAASCSLQKISGVDPIYTGTSTTGFGVGIGRYTLSCTDSAGASKLMGSASCYSNADVRED